MQNHKIETNSELIYDGGNIWSTLIFIKIIGSDTLWFPLPPSEVLFYLNCLLYMLYSKHQLYIIWITGMYHDVGGIVSLYFDEVQWHTFLDHISISLHLDSSACSPLSDYI